MTKHEWRERTEEGELRFFRVTRHGSEWIFQSKLASEEAWIDHDPVDLDDLVNFRERLWRKYQRRRASYEDVRQIDDLIAGR